MVEITWEIYSFVFFSQIVLRKMTKTETSAFDFETTFSLKFAAVPLDLFEPQTFSLRKQQITIRCLMINDEWVYKTTTKTWISKKPKIYKSYFSKLIEAADPYSKRQLPSTKSNFPIVKSQGTSCSAARRENNNWNVCAQCTLHVGRLQLQLPTA